MKQLGKVEATASQRKIATTEQSAQNSQQKNQPVAIQNDQLRTKGSAMQNNSKVQNTNGSVPARLGKTGRSPKQPEPVMPVLAQKRLQSLRNEPIAMGPGAL